MEAKKMVGNRKCGATEISFIISKHVIQSMCRRYELPVLMMIHISCVRGDDESISVNVLGMSS